MGNKTPADRNNAVKNLPDTTVAETPRSAAASPSDTLSTPSSKGASFFTRLRPNPDTFGRATESFARFMGTPQFLVWMTIICGSWLAWNWLAPVNLQFDPRGLNFTLLTLILSLQASYAAPLLLLAQNRQDDRDRVIYGQDRLRGERNLADTEYLNREMASLRIALRDMATRDYVRTELRSLLEEIQDMQKEHDKKLAELLCENGKAPDPTPNPPQPGYSDKEP